MALFDRLKSSPPPKPGESTGLQASAAKPTSVGGIVSAMSSVSGFIAPEAGTFAMYDRISADPTIALIMAIATSSVRTNQWGWKAREDADPEWLEMVKAVFEPQRPALLRDNAQALEYGLYAGEVIWDRFTLVKKSVRSGKGKPAKKVYRVIWGSGDRIAPRRVKPLLIDDRGTTEPLVDANGNVRGLRNKTGGRVVDLLGAKAYLYTYGGKGGNPWGRSRHENIRKHFTQADQVLDRLGAYHRKIAGIVTQLHYPDGTSKNESGADVPNYQIAQQILREVSAGKSVAFLNKFASMVGSGELTGAAMEKALAAAGKSDWVLSFLDAGGTDFAPGFLDTLAYYNKCFCRGWLRPERSALEADKSGSRADSESHTDTGMADSTLIAADIATAIKEQLIDPFLVAEVGEDARGAVWPEPSPMEDTTSDTLKAIVEAGLANPQLAEPVARKIDWDAILDDQEIPVVEEERGPIGDNLIPLAEQAAMGQQQGGDNAPDPAKDAA